MWPNIWAVMISYLCVYVPLVIQVKLLVGWYLPTFGEPQVPVPTGVLAVDWISVTAAAAIAGAVCMMLATQRRWTLVGLAVLLVVLGLAEALFQPGGPRPTWYAYSLPFSTAASAWFAGWLLTRPAGQTSQSTHN